ncbi:MAG: T9SS type A sorting domain-containing protein, partial [Bacteroidales bacterium]|nr:T9SS type A sorting domain-containing protein [Bacteroidales bacterium]
IQLSGLVENAASLLWETPGDGTFDDNTLASATYYPGAADVSNGDVTLCLKASGSEYCEPVSDCLILTIQKLPYVEVQDLPVVCEGKTINISALATHYSLLLWSSDGDGTFDFTDQLSAGYTPGFQDVQNGYVNLCLSASGIAGCETVTDCSTVNIQRLPLVNAGDDQMICKNEFVELNGSAQYYETLLWSTTGDGTFGNPEMLSTIYQPGPADITAGNIELCLTAFGLNGCDSNEECTEVILLDAPLAFAGSDQTICMGANVFLQGTMTNASSSHWETLGDGTFQNSANLNTTYYPGAGDILNMNVQLCLTSFGNDNCEPANDCLDIAFMPGATSNAGADLTICEGQNVYLSGNATGNSSLLWTTSGTGNFSNPQLLNPIYMPSAADILNGSLNLCLNAFSQNGCGTVSDCLNLTINQEVGVDAGNDISICENELVVLNGFAEYYTGLVWSTDGDGTFEDDQDPATNYYPGSNDTESGIVNLCLAAQGQSPCGNTSDCISIYIYQNPVLLLTDMSFCIDQSVVLTANAGNYLSAIWETMGDGTFENAGVVNAIYYPGQQDLASLETDVCLTLTGNASCEQTTGCMHISFSDLPTAFAGDNDVVTIGSFYEFSDAAAENYTSVEWFTNGSGTFENTAVIHAVYYPESLDTEKDSVQFIFLVNQTQPCNIAVSDTVYLHVNSNDCIDVIVSAGEDQIVCESNTFTPNSADSHFATALLWTTTGDGTFNDQTILHPVYTPGEQDIENGSVDLKLKGFAQEPCIADFDIMTLTIQNQILAFAGSDNTIPLEGYTILDSYVENESMIQWSVTGGLGDLVNDNTIHPTYYPADPDLGFGVTLTVQISPVSPCVASVTESVILHFTESCNDAITDAGENIIICANDSIVQLNGYASGFSSLLWTSAGDGTFNYDFISAPEYTLGINDKISGEIMLYLYAESFGNCQPAFDSVLIKPSVIPEVYAGPDLTICQGDIAQIEQATAINYSTMEWSTSGDGIFSEYFYTGTKYYPGQNDIDNGNVVLTLSALSMEPCQVTITDQIMLDLDKLPVMLDDIEDTEATYGDDVPLVVIAKYAKSYQWYGPDGLMAGETLPVLLLEEVDFDDAGYYYCELGNECGISTSSVARVSVFEVQTIAIPAGWSGLSSFIIPYNLHLDSVFKDYQDDLIMLKNYSGIYSPVISLNTLGNWNTLWGYEVNFENPVSFVMKGITNSNRTIAINTGWNIIPVISSCPVNIDDLFSGHVSDVDIIKEIAGVGVYWPAIGINTIGELMPGKAYCLRASAAFEVSFEVCESTKSGFINSVSMPENRSFWNNIHYTPATHIIAIDQQLINTLEAGDIIGAFTTGGTCAGYLEVNGHEDALVLFGDDPLSDDTDGFVENEILRFRIFRPSSGEEIDFYPEFNTSYPHHNGVFVNNGISGLIKASVNAIGNDENGNESINIYPNPTFGKVSVSGLNNGSTIEVLNSQGQLLRKVEIQQVIYPNLLSIDLSDSPGGVLYFRIFDNKLITIKKVIVK